MNNRNSRLSRNSTHTHTPPPHTDTMTCPKSELEADKHALVVSEFIPNRLYFVTFRNKTHRNTTDFHYFTTDDELVYNNYYADFGPLNLAAVAKYINKMNFKLKSPSLASKVIVHFTSSNEKKRVNAAFLIAVYAIVNLKMTPNEAYNRLCSLKYPYTSFQDASMGESQFKVRLIDCLNAVRKAVFFGIVNFDDFNIDEYEKMDNIKNGDVSWIVPEKFLAFSGPVDSPGEECYHAPEYYLNYFRENKVNTVIRLNVKMYNSKSFSNAGVAHYELYFVDGSVPSHEIVTRFFDITENASGAVAVHCKAGLGRTGCLIGAYLIKHYRMTALEAIAWMRICRPGCVIGYQQTWLEEMEPALWNMGDSYRLRYHGGVDRIHNHKYGIYSFRNKEPNQMQSVEGLSCDCRDMQQGSTPTLYPHPSLHASPTATSSKTETQGDKLNAVKRWRDMQQTVKSFKKVLKKTH
ncbi:dual specificity protein phosphatase CDC14AB-like [Homalodisca vitripennis]|uniref:dual specificity protein phosphatase CDC14AB-like n=1 Tax=Homalodisca vitripennis TaxID=197043 RepID=UPI001EE9E070|nr:dual specificity protein phosphatase CDC14AB-like [Homalodisca vitripennis]